MIKHVALFRWKDGTTPEAVAAFGAALDAMVPKVETIRSYEHGRDLGVSDGTWDYAVVAGFDSADEAVAYATHPDHVHVVEHYSKPILESVVRVQFES